MKRICQILFAVTLLTSCSRDGIVDVEQRQIVFQATVESRGAGMYSGELERFYATAFVPEVTNQGPYLKTYFEDEEFLIAVDGNFYSNPPYYYPASLEVIFMLYYPSVEELGCEFCWDEYKWDWEKEDGYWERDLYMAEFSPNEDISKQHDFIMAQTHYDPNNPEIQPIGVVFEHLMSQIRISAKSDSQNYKYHVKGIKLGNIANVGNLDISSKWNIVSGKKTDYVKIYNEAITLSSYKSIMPSEDDSAFLLPQTLADDAYLAVYIQVTDNNGKKVYPEGDSEFDWASIALTGTWDSSDRYEYKLDFTNWFEKQQAE